MNRHKVRDIVHRFLQFFYLSLRIFPINQNKVVLDNFSGKDFGDNPAYIAKKILELHPDWKIIWLSRKPGIKAPQNVLVVKYRSLRAVYHLTTAKFWVDNVRNSFRPIKRSAQIYLQTWHGSFGPKKAEGEAENELSDEYVRAAKQDASDTDAIVVSDELQLRTMRESFWLSPQTQFLKMGTPRNDIFFQPSAANEDINILRSKLHIPENAGVALYMPTFRDDFSVEGYQLDVIETMRALKERFDKDYYILIRMHPNVESIPDCIKLSAHVINVSDLADAQLLYYIADIMITDYSSAPSDFSLLRKPVFLLTLDINDYVESRGLNPIFDSLPYLRSDSNDELVHNILDFDSNGYWRKYDQFRNEYKSYEDGNASENIVKWMTEQVR